VGLPPDLDAVWLTVQAAIETLRESGRTRQTPLRFVRHHNRDLLYSATVGGDTAPSRLGQGSPAKESIRRLLADYDVFVGRETQLVELDRFVTDNTARQLLIWEPTGQGKTALLIHWIQMLEQRDDLTVLFLPISHRAKTDTIEVALPHLAIGLAEVHGEQPDPQDLTRPDKLRLIIQELLGRSPDTRLVVVIDGLDETTGWEVDARLFPARLPERVKIVAAAKATAQTTREQLLRQLGWQHEPTTNISPLAGLTDRDIADMLARRKIASDTPALDELTEGVARVSQRDPLAVRMITQDLKSGDITADQLDTLPTGLKAYFEHSLQDIVERSADSDAVEAIMGLCATAHGPLTAEDLAALDPDRLGRGTVQATAIREVDRYLSGNRNDGYTPQHPYLGQLYLEELLDDEPPELRERFVTWGTDRLATSIEGVPDYLIRFWITHLAETGRWTTVREVCLDPDPTTPGGRPRWAAAQHLATGNYAGYIADISILMEHASENEDVVTVFRCALATSSVRSAAGNLPTILPALLVKYGTNDGCWSLPTAFGYIRSMADPQRRSESLIHLAPLIEDGTDDLSQAVAIASSIEEPDARARTLISLSKRSTNPQPTLTAAFDAAKEILNPEARAHVLTELLPELEQLPPEFPIGQQAVGEALRAATAIFEQAMKVDPTLQLPRIRAPATAKALRRIAPYLNSEQLTSALEATRTIAEPEARAEALVGLLDLPKGHPSLDLLETFPQVHDVIRYGTPGLPAWLNPQSEGSWSSETARALIALSSLLPGEWVPDGLDVANHVEDPGWRALALARIASRLEDPLPVLSDAMDAAATVQDAAWKAEVFAELCREIPNPEPALSEALRAASAIENPTLKAEVLGKVASRLPDPRPALTDALSAAATIESPAARAEVLSTLATQVDDPRPVRGEALKAVAAIDDSTTLTEVLARLVEQLDGGQLEEASDLAAAIRHPLRKSEALTAIAGRFPDPRPSVTAALAAVAAAEGGSRELELLVAIAQQVDPPHLATALALVGTTDATSAFKEAALTGLAEHLDSAQLEQARRIAEEIQDPGPRSKALCSLVPRLTDKNDIIRSILDSAASADDWWLADALVDVAPHLDESQLPSIFTLLESIEMPYIKSRAVIGLKSGLKRPPVKRLLESAMSISDPRSMSEAILGLVDTNPDPGDIKLALAAARGVAAHDWRARTLIKLFDHFEPSQTEVREALSLLPEVHETDRPELLIDISTHLSGEQANMALTMAADIEPKWLRCQVLFGIAEHHHVPNEMLEEIRDDALQAAIGSTGRASKALALRSLVPYLNSGQLSEALSAAASIGNPHHRVEAIAGIARRLQGEQLNRALVAADLGEALAFGDAAAEPAEQLLEQLGPTQLADAVEIARQIEFPTSRARMFAMLARHLRESSEVLTEALRAANMAGAPPQQAAALLDLIPALALHPAMPAFLISNRGELRHEFSQLGPALSECLAEVTYLQTSERKRACSLLTLASLGDRKLLLTAMSASGGWLITVVSREELNSIAQWTLQPVPFGAG
jgi:hypothetical protein